MMGTQHSLVIENTSFGFRGLQSKLVLLLSRYMGCRHGGVDKSTCYASRETRH